MTTWWDEKAVRMQQDVRASESAEAPVTSDKEAWRAAVCTREDMVIAIVHLSTAISFLSGIRRWLIALTVAVFAICIRLYLP
jgi:hypothetical protein